MDLIEEYYSHINNAEKYNCDRCNIVELRYDEYINNYMFNGFTYCDECINFIKIQKFKCIYCNNEWSIRSERLLHKECECKGIVVKCQ